MSDVELTNTSNIRFLRFYIRCLHQHLQKKWDFDHMNTCDLKELRSNLNDLLQELDDGNHPQYVTHSDIEDYLSILKNNSKKYLLDKTQFDWIHSERATYFT